LGIVLLGVETDASEFVTDLFGRPGGDDNVTPLFVVEGVADNAAPAIDTGFVVVGHAVDVVKNHEVWIWIFEPAENTAFVVPEYLLELVG
jgi:hypothetical protein